MTTSGSLLFVTGSFQNANGVATADDIAYFDGTTWHPLGSNGAGNGPLSSNGLALAIFNHSVVVGGSFLAGTDPIANNIASYSLLRPDMRIGLNQSGPFVGNNVYSATGAGEAKTISVHRGHSGVFWVDIQNDGLQGGLWWIQAPAGSNGFTVTYFNGATNVTTQVENGGVPISLTPGAHHTLEMVVKLSANSGNSHTFLIHAVPAGLIRTNGRRQGHRQRDLSRRGSGNEKAGRRRCDARSLCSLENETLGPRERTRSCPTAHAPRRRCRR